MAWVRLWHDMPTDPVWRVIARRSGQRIGDVIAMFNMLMVQAGENPNERGRTQGNDDDEIAAALDIEPEQVSAIREAMQGKVLDGDRLSGWEKRQPKREDGSAERAKAWRDAQKNGSERNRTKPNAGKRPDADADADAEPPSGGRGAKRSTTLPSDFAPVLTEQAQAIADRLGPARYDRELQKFKDRNTASGQTYKDWQAAFRTWLSNAEGYGARGDHRGGGWANA